MTETIKRVNIRDLRLDRLERLIDRLPDCYDFDVSRSGWTLYSNAWALSIKRRQALHSIMEWNVGHGVPIADSWWGERWVFTSSKDLTDPFDELHEHNLVLRKRHGLWEWITKW
jgi:hypothetical protein